MTKPICSEADCDVTSLARGLCVTHYHRWNRATKNQRPPVGVCQGCGGLVSKSSGPPSHYCSPDCRPRCDVQGCNCPTHGRQWCSTHKSRADRLGDPNAPLLRLPNEGDCSVDGCDSPMRKNRVCATHAGMLRTFGEIREFNHRWSTSDECVVCSGPTGVEYGYRLFCSARCRAYARYHGVGPYLHRADSFELSASELAERDGSYCQLCGCDVDMTARLPDQMCPSVDHIVPLSRGGSNGEDNLQLAHLACNRSKGNHSTASLLKGVLVP